MILGGVGEVIIFEHGCYISALAHIRMFILSICVLLERINTIYKIWSRLGDLVRCKLIFILGLRSSISEV